MVYIYMCRRTCVCTFVHFLWQFIETNLICRSKKKKRKKKRNTHTLLRRVSLPKPILIHKYLNTSFFFFFFSSSFAPSLFYSLAWVLYKIQSHKFFLINPPLLLCPNFTKQKQKKKTKWNKTELTEPTDSYCILLSVNLFEQNVDLCWSYIYLFSNSNSIYIYVIEKKQRKRERERKIREVWKEHNLYYQLLATQEKEKESIN